MISVVWVIISILTAGTVCGETQISDSVTPMKVEIHPVNDSDTNGMISKTVSLRNTGDVPVHYIIYIEGGGNSKASSLFELSADAASVDPGEKFELQISASKNEIEKYTAAELENIKIKLVRNPDTQTPVGYIIPVTVGSEADTKTNGAAGKTFPSETDTGTANQTVDFGNSTASGGRNTAADGDGSGIKAEDDTGEISKIKKESEKYKMILAALVACFILLSAGGLYTGRNRKKE